jgi:hypothetical protein
MIQPPDTEGHPNDRTEVNVQIRRDGRRRSRLAGGALIASVVWLVAFVVTLAAYLVFVLTGHQAAADTLASLLKALTAGLVRPG